MYDFATPVTAKMTLYVKWKALFTVKFDAGIDMTPALRKIVVEGDVAHAPDPSELPSNPGKIIYGWTKNFSTKIPYDFETPVTGNFTLIAMWSDIYTVNFETNGGSAVETQILGSKNYVKVPEPPTKPGFVFEGWYRNEGLTVPYDFEQFVINGNFTRTIYAKWTEL